MPLVLLATTAPGQRGGSGNTGTADRRQSASKVSWLLMTRSAKGCVRPVSCRGKTWTILTLGVTDRRAD